MDQIIIRPLTISFGPNVSREQVEEILKTMVFTGDQKLEDMKLEGPCQKD